MLPLLRAHAPGDASAGFPPRFPDAAQGQPHCKSRVFGTYPPAPLLSTHVVRLRPCETRAKQNRLQLFHAIPQPNSPAPPSYVDGFLPIPATTPPSDSPPPTPPPLAPGPDEHSQGPQPQPRSPTVARATAARPTRGPPHPPRDTESSPAAAPSNRHAPPPPTPRSIRAEIQ